MDMQVLSVKTALSIQSHPDKKLAERLHAQNPEVSNSDITTPRNQQRLALPASHKTADVQTLGRLSSPRYTTQTISGNSSINSKDQLTSDAW